MYLMGTSCRAVLVALWSSVHFYIFFPSILIMFFCFIFKRKLLTLKCAAVCYWYEVQFFYQFLFLIFVLFTFQIVTGSEDGTARIWGKIQSCNFALEQFCNIYMFSYAIWPQQHYFEYRIHIGILVVKN